VTFSLPLLSRLPLSFFCNSGFIDMNCFIFCLSWKTLFVHQFWRITFLDIAILEGSHLFSEVELHHSMFF
jgi:hypothetical protein